MKKKVLKELKGLRKDLIKIQRSPYKYTEDDFGALYMYLIVLLDILLEIE